MADRAPTEADGAAFGVPALWSWTGIEGVDGSSGAEKLVERLRRSGAMFAGLMNHQRGFQQAAAKSWKATADSEATRSPMDWSMRSTYHLNPCILGSGSSTGRGASSRGGAPRFGLLPAECCWCVRCWHRSFDSRRSPRSFNL